MSSIALPTVSMKSTCKTPNQGSSCSPKKIPRPPNSFLIYRKEHAKAYKGLVATELSSKLAEAWNNETPECRAHYARLAEKAKKEHAIKYPNYKFTPIKRGTGKRALALAAMANAAKKSASETASATQSMTPIATTATTTSTNNMLLSMGTEGNCRSRRNVQKPHRFATTAPYPFVSSPAKQGPVMAPSSTDAAAMDLPSPSLFFNPCAIAQWTQTQTVPTQLPSQAPTTLSLPASPTLSSTSASDIDELEGNESGQQFSQAFEQLLSNQGYDNAAYDSVSRWAPSWPSAYPEDAGSIFGVSTFPSLLSLESFEPECLAREDAQWTTTASEAMCPMLTSSPASGNCGSMASSYGYPAPSFEDCSSMLFAGLDVSTSSLYTPVIVPSQASMEIPFLSKDMMMSSTLTNCSPMAFTMTRTHPNAQDYLASGLDLL
ncbi:hypothetical protein BGX31_001822 [Mortierella sp. GBA43]|nr:hypothetical protein BGX31_001822 [Mortierella sp. GBA43]